MRIALTLPGMNGAPVDSDLPVPTGGLFGTGTNAIRAFILIAVIGSILFAFYLILQGGMDLITSQGHKEKIVHAREKIIFAILGLLFIFLCFILMSAANAFTGTNLLYPFF
jgi:hypothetical protein